MSLSRLRAPNCSFPIRRDRQTLSGNPPDINDTNSYSGLASPPDKKRHKLYNYGVKTTLSSNPYSWLYIEMDGTFAWLLKSYWNPDSLLLNPIERHLLFLTIAAMFDSGHNRSQYRPSESSGQQSPQASINPVG
ncbi:hypothetical protein [Endozoicomonas sp. 8E]|uniref:hypothetical protein n=1 Tax=Endozoicomonas sp. 8E TaxID=3035692 RepID=UPI0029394BE1|nr:hypothetical protein [Endozoicomonas sp. 8E]WOG27109.1 hypothetical protein P6910_21540 [Endozoicomonas sp. 8E]